MKEFNINNVHITNEIGSSLTAGGHRGAQVTRDKPVAKPAPGVRKCNCRNKVVTRQLGPGMFQQFQQQECQVWQLPPTCRWLCPSALRRAPGHLTLLTHI